MGWKWQIFTEGILGDKKKRWNCKLACPYLMCPSNQPFMFARKPRMKFNQKIAPTVYQYRCKDCGCLINVGLEVLTMEEQSRTAQALNPALIQRKPSYRFIKGVGG